VMFASHELDRAEAVATRTVTISGGVVLGDSDVDDVARTVGATHDA